MVVPLDSHLVIVGSIPTGPTHGEGRLQPHPGDVLKSTPNVRKSPRSGLNVEGRLSDPQISSRPLGRNQERPLGLSTDAPCRVRDLWESNPCSPSSRSSGLTAWPSRSLYFASPIGEFLQHLLVSCRLQAIFVLRQQFRIHRIGPSTIYFRGMNHKGPAWYSG